MKDIYPCPLVRDLCVCVCVCILFFCCEEINDFLATKKKDTPAPDALDFLAITAEKPLTRVSVKSKTAGFKNIHASLLRPHTQFQMQLQGDDLGDGRADLNASDKEAIPSDQESSASDEEMVQQMVSSVAANAAAGAASSSSSSGIACFCFFVCCF